MTFRIEYSNRFIDFTVIKRKRKTAEIRIEQTNEVVVIVPYGVSDDRIDEIVRKKGAWIIKKLTEVKDIKIAGVEKDICDGDNILYLGNLYRLKIIDNNDIKRDKVYISEKCIIVEIQYNDRAYEVIKNWYMKKAFEIFESRVLFYNDKIDIRPRTIKIKDQKSRWGSCTYNNDLLFNFRCIMLSPEQLDYIVVHEMCHMIEKNHGKGFWNLVELIMPDYKNHRQQLKKIRIS